MLIGEILDRAAIAPHGNVLDKRQALALVADIAARNFGLESGDVLDALSEREQAGSTGIGHGVAAPHARLEGLDRMRAVFVRLETPIAFDAVDDQPVDLLLALISPTDSKSEHLRALARVSRIFRQATLREQLRQAHSADAILALLSQEQHSTAA
jgi:nitrogen PTS system EIIA component